jgi:hypothetical protein
MNLKEAAPWSDGRVLEKAMTDIFQSRSRLPRPGTPMLCGVAALLLAAGFAAQPVPSALPVAPPQTFAHLPMRAIFSESAGPAHSGKLQLAAMTPRGAVTLQATFNDEVMADAVPSLLGDRPEEPAAIEDVDVKQMIRSAQSRHAPMADPQGGCLAEAVYFEARGEPLDGQLAVAQVILNRTKDRRFARSICGVVRERSPGPGKACQFSFVCDTRSDVPPAGRQWDTAQAVAQVALADKTPDLSAGALFFHASRANPKWRHRLAYTRTVGTHLFYR